MRRTLFSLLILSILIGQLFLVTGLQAFSGSGNSASSGEMDALLLPPTARPSLTPSLTPVTNTPTPHPTQPPGPNPTHTPISVTATPLPPTAVIAQKVINVRSGPGVIYNIMGVAHQDERYLVTGQYPPGDWLQINYNGKAGWVYRALVTLEGAIDKIPPITDIPPTPTFTPSPTPTDTPTPTLTPTMAPTEAGATQTPPTQTPPPPTPAPATATPGPPTAIIIGQNVPIRRGPGLIYDEIGLANKGETYPITGLSVTGDWFQIDYKGQPGWVFLIQIEPAADIEQIPIIEDIPPTPTFTPAPATPTPAQEAQATLAPVTPPPVPPAESGGPPTGLLVIGGLLALAIAAGILYYFIRNKST